MRTSRNDGFHITRARTRVLGNNCTVYADDCTLDGHYGTVHGARATINGTGWNIMPSAQPTAIINNPIHTLVNAPTPLAAPSPASQAPPPRPSTCAACGTNPPGALLVPCNHGTVCAPCAAAITTAPNPACPTCGARAPRWRPLFF